MNQQETKEIEVETFSIPEIISLKIFQWALILKRKKINSLKKRMLDTDDDGT
ncbi:hypothetical protein P7H12_25785 [Paenibacillus larvae]|nr:hypothetical protein [Paenibacillus larvae]MDT2266331.1 hypothetical protein [Paenibacillus larvae]